MQEGVVFRHGSSRLDLNCQSVKVSKCQISLARAGVVGFAELFDGWTMERLDHARNKLSCDSWMGQIKIGKVR